jgi:hypothetical protein
MNEIKETENAVTLFSTSEKVLLKIEQYIKLEIINTASENTVRKSRQLTKKLMVDVEKRRLKNTRDFKQKNDETASTIRDRLTPVYNNLDEKIKAVEAKRDKAKNEKIAAEQERLKYINLSLEALSNLAAGDPLSSSEQLEQNLTWIKDEDLEEDEFQEFLERAQEIKLAGIKNTQTALDNRIKIEEETARLDEQNKAQEEETARLDKINAEALKALQVQKDTLDAEAKTLAEEKAKFKKEKVESEKIRLLALEEKEAAEKFKENRDLAYVMNNQINYGQELATELDLIIYSETWTEAHKQNNVMNLGIERAAEMEEKYQEDLQLDKIRFTKLTEKINQIIYGPFLTIVGNALVPRIEKRIAGLTEFIFIETDNF